MAGGFLEEATRFPVQSKSRDPLDGPPLNLDDRHYDHGQIPLCPSLAVRSFLPSPYGWL